MLGFRRTKSWPSTPFNLGHRVSSIRQIKQHSNPFLQPLRPFRITRLTLPAKYSRLVNDEPWCGVASNCRSRADGRSRGRQLARERTARAQGPQKRTPSAARRSKLHVTPTPPVAFDVPRSAILLSTSNRSSLHQRPRSLHPSIYPHRVDPTRTALARVDRDMATLLLPLETPGLKRESGSSYTKYMRIRKILRPFLHRESRGGADVSHTFFFPEASAKGKGSDTFRAATPFRPESQII